MASHGPGEKFRSALVKSSKLLTEANIQELAYLSEEISPARREKITNGIQLFTELQSHNQLSEDDVTKVIEWMDDLKLGEAAQPLKEYKQYDATKGDAPSSKKCPIHSSVPLMYACVSCDVQVCPECLHTTHKPSDNCDVIRLDQMEQEKIRRAEKLLEEIQEALSQVNSAKELWEEKKREIMTNQAKRKLDLANLFGEMEHILDLRHQIEYLKRRRNEPSGNSLLELRNIRKDEEEISKIKRRVRKPMISVLVGRVCLLNNAILNIYDNRRCDGGVFLVCIDPTDPGKEYLRHTVKVDDHQSPVVMSYRPIWYDRINHALFAVGKTVYIVRPHYVLPGPVSPLVIGEVPDGAYITSIAGCGKPGDEPEKEFLISISGSSVLREYDVTGSLLRSIETRDHVPSGGITGIAYNGDTVAVISSGSNEVILLARGGTAGSSSTAGPRSSGSVKRCGSLRPPAGLSPVIVMWPGARWLLLCTGGGLASQWSVIHYDKTGKRVRVCVEGIFTSDLDVPVSFTRWNHTGYVTLQNSTIREFNF